VQVKDDDQLGRERTEPLDLLDGADGGLRVRAQHSPVEATVQRGLGNCVEALGVDVA
jgi:hypothetical protein